FVSMLIWAYRAGSALKRGLAKHGSVETSMHAAAVCAAVTVVLIAGIFVDYLQAEVQIWMLAMLASLLYVRLPAESAQALQKAPPAPAGAVGRVGRAVAPFARKASRRGEI